MERRVRGVDSLARDRGWHSSLPGHEAPHSGGEQACWVQARGPIFKHNYIEDYSFKLQIWGDTIQSMMMSISLRGG